MTLRMVCARWYIWSAVSVSSGVPQRGLRMVGHATVRVASGDRFLGMGDALGGQLDRGCQRIEECVSPQLTVLDARLAWRAVGCDLDRVPMAMP